MHMIKNGMAVLSSDFHLLAEESSELLKQWRVPEVGSVFEGKKVWLERYHNACCFKGRKRVGFLD